MRTGAEVTAPRAALLWDQSPPTPHLLHLSHFPHLRLFSENKLLIPDSELCILGKKTRSSELCMWAASGMLIAGGFFSTMNVWLLSIPAVHEGHILFSFTLLSTLMSWNVFPNPTFSFNFYRYVRLGFHWEKPELKPRKGFRTQQVTWCDHLLVRPRVPEWCEWSRCLTITTEA